MYWNVLSGYGDPLGTAININMRCIEMMLSKACCNFLSWLTLTWDVLKFAKDITADGGAIGLTLTWDVLKFPIDYFVILIGSGLTLTWDVLKF